MFGSRPAPPDRQRACEMALRVNELRDEAALLRGLAAFERDAVMMGLFHDLVTELNQQMTLLRLEEMAF